MRDVCLGTTGITGWRELGPGKRWLTGWNRSLTRSNVRSGWGFGSTGDSGSPLLTPNDVVWARPSTPLTYTVTWLDSEVPQDVQVECWVTAGTCAVTALDQVANQATVEWRDAPLLEDHEIVVAVGNQHYFITAKDRVSFLPVD